MDESTHCSLQYVMKKILNPGVNVFRGTNKISELAVPFERNGYSKLISHLVITNGRLIGLNEIQIGSTIRYELRLLIEHNFARSLQMLL